MDSSIDPYELVPFVGTSEKNGVLWDGEVLRDGVYQPRKQNAESVRMYPCRFYYHPASQQVAVWITSRTGGDWTMLEPQPVSRFHNFERRASQPPIAWSQTHTAKVLKSDRTWHQPVFRVKALMPYETVAAVARQALLKAGEVDFCGMELHPEASPDVVQNILSPLMAYTLASLGVLRA